MEVKEQPDAPRAEVADEQLQASFLRGRAERGQEGGTAQAGEGCSAGSSLGDTPTKASVSLQSELQE